MPPLLSQRRSLPPFTPASLLSMIPLALAVLLSTTSTLLFEGVDAQTPVAYQPIAYAASAILADGGFYLYGGTVQFGDSLVGTNQFLRLDLTKSFSTASPPWTSVLGNMIYTMIDAAPSQSGQQLILGGNRDHNGQSLASAYDLNSNAWVTLPGTISTPDPTYKRSNIGMALDKSTGLVVIYGGFGYLNFLQEISTLDTATNPNPQDFKWDVSFNQTVIPMLYSPFVLYLPTLKQTLVIGGGDRYNVTSGYVSRAASLAEGYLVSGATTPSTTSIIPQTLTFAGGPAQAPPPRYQACKVVMDDGNVLIQGGRDPTLFYGDTWVLNVTTWVWTNKTVNGPVAAMTRAGHTCGMGPNGQVLIVGGFYNTNAGVSSFVNPAVAVLNTKTWTWTATYTGAPVGQIWTPATTPPGQVGGGGDTGGNNGGNSNNNGTNNNNNNGSSTTTSSGLSSGAKGGIGAGVALVLVGLAAFIFWKKRTGRQQIDKTAYTATSQHHQQPPATITEKNYSGGDDPSAGSAMAGSVLGGNGGGMSPISLHSQVAQHAPPMSNSSTSTAALSTLPLYAMNDSSTTPGSTGPAISYATKPQPLPAGGKFGGYFVKSPHTGSKDNDEAIAAALLQAEDKITSSPHQSPTVDHTSPSNSQDVYSAKMGSGSPDSTAGQLNPQGLARSPALASASLSSFDAFSNVYSPNAPHRVMLNPQSVPEHEARIERFSPGVRTHVVNTAKDQNAQGLYPPLTASRPYGFASTIIGTPAAHPNSTPASSFSAAAAAAVADAANGTPTEAQPQATGYFGHQQLDASQHQQSPQDHQQQPFQYQQPPQQYGSPQTSPYRDPRMMRDLEDIARMIESQTMAEPQHPHTLQNP